MATRKSGIPVKSSTGSKAGGVSPSGPQARSSSIPVKKTKNEPIKSATPVGEPSNSPKRERELQEAINRLENEVKEKNSAINDLNEKLMQRINECQVLQEENEIAKQSLHSPSDREVSGKIKDLEKLLNEKETFIEKMLTNKQEIERKFEVEIDMLKNQHELELLSLEQRLQDAHQEKIDELETSLKNVSGTVKEIPNQGSSAEINTLHEELLRTKLRYENQIFDLKQQLEMVTIEKDDLVEKQKDERNEVHTMKEKHKEEIETLKYLVQEKDILINDSTSNRDTQGAGFYTDEDVTRKLEELRIELTTRHEHNLQLANDLWRKKFEENQGTDLDRTTKQSEQGTDEVSDLKEQLQEAHDLHEEQNEILETQEKEIEELRESNKEFEDRYTTLYKEMETKWQSEFSESEIIEKIKSHYEMEIERLHGELEDIQNENGNLKTELDLMANDFDGGRSRGPARRPSVTARLDMKAELEDYKVQVATLERDLQHALNQNERLKLESRVKNGELAGSKLEEVTSINNKIDELQTERGKLIAEKDDYLAKCEELKKERKKLEKDLKIREEENTKMKEELQTKNDETALLKNDYETRIKNSEAKVLEMKENISVLTSKCEKAECDLLSLRETLEKSENHERDLKATVEELNAKEVNLTQGFTDAKSKILALEEELNMMSLQRNSTQDELNKLKDIEEGKVAETKRRVTELQNMLAQRKVANEALKVKYDKLLTENETKTSKLAELTAALSEKKTEFENSEVKSENPLREHNTPVKGSEHQPHETNEEYDLLTRKYEKAVQENETKSRKIGEIESLFREKNIEYVTLTSKYNELCAQDKSKESRIADLETEIKQQKSEVDDMEMLNNNLKNENVILEAKVSNVENLLKQNKDECEALKRNNESLCTENEKTISGAKDVEAALDKSREQYQILNEDYQKVLQERSVMNSDIEQLKKDATQVCKQITAFEKKVAMQEREKKGLEEKVSSSDKTIEGQKKEILSLKEKCESYDWKNMELETQLEGVKNTEDRLKTCMERNQELLCVIEEATREKNDLLKKQAELMEKNKELKDERDTLKNEKGVYESEREQDTSEHERKLETAQKKLKEKDRVLNETKKHSRQLKESEKELKEKFSEKETKCLELEERVKELNEKLKYLSKDKEDLNETKKQTIDLEGSFEQKNKQCLDLEGRLEQMNNQNTKLKQQLEETKNVYSEQEQVWRDEIKRQKDNFARELKNVQENMEQSAQIEISRLTQEKNEDMRKEMTRLNEENHALKIRLDDQGIEVSKEKEEKYKMEKLKDQFRFQVESLQERLDTEQEKTSELENEHLRDEERINEERKKLLATLDEYELKNSKLLSDIDKASGVLKTTKEKYVKLKDKFNSLAKKYKKMNEEKLNKSDVQVGPDTSVDLSLVVEDLQRCKETAEETNLRLRVELDKLREEIGRSEYQVKAVRKANVVLMKQSRTLYQESEEHKRLDEEREQELQKYRDMKENLQQENNTSQKQRELLEKQVKELAEETVKLKRENDEYFLEKNRREIELEEKANECVSYCRQLEKLKHENEFLYQQGRKLQADLDVTRMKPMVRVNSKPDENRNFFYGFDNELTKGNLRKDTLTDLGTIKDFGTGRQSEASQLGESTSSLSFDEARSFIPPVFNNEKIIGDKVIESANKKNTFKSSPPNKDINIQISKINNEFATEKYLGKAYWDTLEFLKKK